MASSTIKSRIQQQADVPIFLRKTYHMIDTCDAAIACWSDDGETFIIKDPVKFESTIIPQFFKHSKFTSFVRQLNFYSFRKIKYADTIRIDRKLEEETANYWRFHHPKFQRGKAEWLTQIKRMNNASKNAAAAQQKEKNGGGAAGAASASAEKKDSTAAAAAAGTASGNGKEMKSEVQTLKKRIEEMTKNIDDLTAMVQSVSLKQEEKTSTATPDQDGGEEVGCKRKKTATDAVVPDAMLSSAMELDSMDLALEAVVEDILPPLPVSSSSVSSPTDNMSMEREVSTGSAASSSSSAISDNAFVDQLFTAFADEGDDSLAMSEESLDRPQDPQDYRQPDPVLMKRLGEALALLPRDIQELIINRLIDAITSPDGLAKNNGSLAALSSAVASCTAVEKNKKSAVPVPQSPLQSSSAVAPTTTATTSAADESSTATAPQATTSLPLAAATLAALLHHYGSQQQQQQPRQPTSATEKNKNVKSIPVIPVHA